MSQHDDTIRALQVQMSRNAKTIASQRGTITKLRKELERVRDRCHANWERAETCLRGWQEADRDTAQAERMFEALASAIGRKA